jgi:hypothetical protein
VGVRTCSTRWRARETPVQTVLGRKASAHTQITSRAKQLAEVKKL